MRVLSVWWWAGCRKDELCYAYTSADRPCLWRQWCATQHFAVLPLLPHAVTLSSLRLRWRVQGQARQGEEGGGGQLHPAHAVAPQLQVHFLVLAHEQVCFPFHLFNNMWGVVRWRWGHLLASRLTALYSGGCRRNQSL
jgi:hypothetical protein